METELEFFFKNRARNLAFFRGDGHSDRIALVYNLVTTQIKKVFEIENKNFLIGFLRYKINPYLNNLFKNNLI